MPRSLFCLWTPLTPPNPPRRLEHTVISAHFCAEKEQLCLLITVYLPFSFSFVSCSEYCNCSECHPSLHPPLKRGEERSSMAIIDCKSTQSAMPASRSEGVAASPHRRLRSCQFYLTSRQSILLKWSLKVWSYQWYDKEPAQLKFTMGKNWWEQREWNRKYWVTCIHCYSLHAF